MYFIVTLLPQTSIQRLFGGPRWTRTIDPYFIFVRQTNTIHQNAVVIALGLEPRTCCLDLLAEQARFMNFLVGEDGLEPSPSCL